MLKVEKYTKKVNVFYESLDSVEKRERLESISAEFLKLSRKMLDIGAAPARMLKAMTELEDSQIVFEEHREVLSNMTEKLGKDLKEECSFLFRI